MTRTPEAPHRGQRAVHRGVVERIVVTGVLELVSPAHFGNGDADPFTDLPVLVDEVDGRAVITGASLAGALRNHLREVELGYDVAPPPRDETADDFDEVAHFEGGLLASCLFGSYPGAEGDQSPLIVDDAFATRERRAEVALRDGVALDPATRTAVERKKYDYQVLPAGTQFDLRFELLLTGDDEDGRMKQALALVLDGLATGAVTLGAKKRRGLGRCKVSEWTVSRYDLRMPDGLLAWLAADHPDWGHRSEVRSGPTIAELLGLEAGAAGARDARRKFEIDVRLAVDGSLLVRSGVSGLDVGPDVGHLCASAAGRDEREPVLPGTSVGGALRQRALRIVRTLAGRAGEGRAAAFVEDMFGPVAIREGTEARASRVVVSERRVIGGESYVQTRIKIDRFTGGAYGTALLEEAPWFGGESRLTVTLRNPADAEVGLLLLLLKDLWLGDLPVGGGLAVGRGRLRGLRATLTLADGSTVEMGADGALAEEDSLRLESFVSALNATNWEATR